MVKLKIFVGIGLLDKQNIWECHFQLSEVVMAIIPDFVLFDSSIMKKSFVVVVVRGEIESGFQLRRVSGNN